MLKKNPNEKIDLSIVIPSFNQGEYIEKTIKSILTQKSEFNIEVIVVDGASTDNTLEILKKYEDKIYWISEKDEGQTDAINKGIKLSSGEIFAYINSDDFYEDDILNQVISFFKNHSEADFLYGDFNYVDKYGEIIERRKSIEFDKNILLFDHNFICQPASFWRKNLFDKIGVFDKNLYYYMDYEFFLRAAFSGAKFHYLPIALANLRIYGETKTVSGKNSNKLQMHEERKNVLNRIDLYAKSNEFFRFVKKIYNRIKYIKKTGLNFYLFKTSNRALMKINQ